MIVHGTFGEDKVGSKVVEVAPYEYISLAEGWHGFPNGQNNYGDCIQKMRLRITNKQTKEQRYSDWFGSAQDLANPVAFKWEGRLYTLAGCADNTLPQAGLKGLIFGAIATKIGVASSFKYGGDRTEELLGESYNDLEKYGSWLNYACPIQSIAVWYGQVIDGMEITYNLSDGKTIAVMHGVQGGEKAWVVIRPTERIVEVNGLSGIASRTSDWGVQLQLLSFKIYDSVTESYRTVGNFGTLLDGYFLQESRKDICVRGPLIGLSGRANNSLNQVGLGVTVFHTQCPL
ncbi:Jacalin-like lectin domain protein [Ceratobasidium sp. AG-Ba]|nr:Jacalin-like lectin domain protein [Ceratobasidium sp. AG-Ba]